MNFWHCYRMVQPPRWARLALPVVLGALVAGCTASPHESSALVNGWRSLPMPSIYARVLAVVPDGKLPPMQP